MKQGRFLNACARKVNIKIYNFKLEQRFTPRSLTYIKYNIYQYNIVYNNNNNM